MRAFRETAAASGGAIGITNNIDWREPLTAAPEDVKPVQAPGGIDRDCCNIETFPTPEAVCQCKGLVCEDEAAENGHYCPRGSNETAAQCCAHKTEVCT